MAGARFLSLKIAVSSLRAHKLRALLAVLGVFLGALALTGVQNLSLAMQRKAELEIERLGPNLFMAVSGQLRMRREGSAALRRAARTFTLADAVDLQGSLPGVLAGAPMAAAEMPVRSESSKTECQIMGTWPEYSDIRSFKPEHGRFLTRQDVDDMAMVCVLGRTIAQRLFTRPEEAVGRMVFFYRAGLRVVGVMEEKGADIVGANQDEQVFVPLSTYMRRMSNQDWISGVYLRLAKETDPETVKAAAEELLRRRHNIGPGRKDDFSVMAAKDTVRLQQEALGLVRTLGLISSSVSFAVGGLGILSIMVLMVRMRRLEIGVRRAMGARRRDVVRQFLMEAGLMSTTGGVLGVGFSLVLLGVVCAVAQFPFTADPFIMGFTLVGTAGLGVGAGAYPAWQASRYEVLDVLREE